MTRWNLSIPDDADRLVRVFLARRGMAVDGTAADDLASFVAAACRSEVLRRTVAEVQERNPALGAAEVVELAGEAVAAMRAKRAGSRDGASDEEQRS